MRSRGTFRPRRTFSRKGITSSGFSGPPKDRTRSASKPSGIVVVIIECYAGRVHKDRLTSLDVFRGGTIAAMIMVNNQASPEAYPQLQHAQWHGWTFTDLVFPFFLWITGISITFSFAKRVARGDDRSRLLLHALRRAAVIFGTGLLLNGFPSYDLA